MERATKFLNVDKKITPPSAFSLSCLLTCCQTPASFLYNSDTPFPIEVFLKPQEMHFVTIV